MNLISISLYHEKSLYKGRKCGAGLQVYVSTGVSCLILSIYEAIREPYFLLLFSF